MNKFWSWMRQAEAARLAGEYEIAKFFLGQARVARIARHG